MRDGRIQTKSSQTHWCSFIFVVFSFHFLLQFYTVSMLVSWALLLKANLFLWLLCKMIRLSSSTTYFINFFGCAEFCLFLRFAIFFFSLSLIADLFVASPVDVHWYHLVFFFIVSDVHRLLHSQSTDNSHGTRVFIFNRKILKKTSHASQAQQKSGFFSFSCGFIYCFSMKLSANWDIFIHINKIL